MKPIDFARETYESIRARLTNHRLVVYQALCIFGPCTTRELASAMGWDVLNVRPRLTELYQMGYVVLEHDPQRARNQREGVYRALRESEARAQIAARIEACKQKELQLELEIA